VEHNAKLLHTMTRLASAAWSFFGSTFAYEQLCSAM